jgi:hypothetical protein
MFAPVTPLAPPPPSLAEDSTDESEREDDEYVAAVHRYSALVQRTLRQIGPDLDAPAEDVGLQQNHTAPFVGLNGAQQRSSCAAPSASGAVGHAVHALPRPRRLYLHGFAPQITAGDIVTSLSQYGPLNSFRLFHDPVSKLSLRAASVVYEDAADAARALEAAMESALYLAKVWAPEAILVADDDGEVARRAYEAVVHATIPPLLACPRASSYGLVAGAAANPPRMMHSAPQQAPPGPAPQHERILAAQLCVSGIAAHCTPQSVKNAFDQLGRVQGFVGARVGGEGLRGQGLATRHPSAAAHLEPPCHAAPPGMLRLSHPCPRPRTLSSSGRLLRAIRHSDPASHTAAASLTHQPASHRAPRLAHHPRLAHRPRLSHNARAFRTSPPPLTHHPRL